MRRLAAMLLALGSASAQAAAQPVLLQIRPMPGDTVQLLLEQTVEMVTTERPAEAVLDPEDILIDLDPSNNRARL